MISAIKVCENPSPGTWVDVVFIHASLQNNLASSLGISLVWNLFIFYTRETQQRSFFVQERRRDRCPAKRYVLEKGELYDEAILIG